MFSVASLSCSDVKGSVPEVESVVSVEASKDLKLSSDSHDVQVYLLLLILFTNK